MSSRALRYASLGGAQIAVGAAAIFARFALGGAGALAVSALRLTIASAAIVAWLALHRSNGVVRPARAVDVRLAIAGFALAAHFALWIWSLEYTSVAASTLLVATTPLWTAIYEAFAQRRMLSVRASIAMAVAAAGMLAVVSGSVARPPVHGHEVAGAFLAVGGAIAIAAYFLLVRGVRARLDTTAIVVRTYGWAAMLLLVAAALARQAPPAFADERGWAGIAGMALISQLLGHTGMNAALRWFSASAVAFSTLLEPVFAAVLAFALFAERLTAAGLIGGLAVLVSVATFLREDASRQAP